MQLKIYANGNGRCKGTHVSVYVYLMKGINDKTLKWPFTGDISISLLNWTENKGHVTEILSFNDNTPLEYRSKVIESERAPRGFGYIDFVSHDELHYNTKNNIEFVRNDTLCFLIRNISISTGNNYVFIISYTFHVANLFSISVSTK